MLRTKLSLSRILFGITACCALVVSGSAVAGPPRTAGGAEPDYEASGFVVPAGYTDPGMGRMTAAMQAGAPYHPSPVYSVAQAGFFQGGAAAPCDGGMCDGSCGGGCAVGGMGGACGCGGGSGGLLGGCGACGGGTGGLLGGCGCGACGGGGGMCNLRSCCLFCRGDGCGVCQSVGTGQFLGLLAGLAPYTDAGIGAQRWYDVSAEALFLAMNASVTQFPITSQGIGPGTIVLGSGNAYNSELDAGVRVSGSMIFGVAGSLEATYMGVYDLGGSANVQSAGPNFYSFASNFGTFPPNGYDDTDRSLFQGVSSSSRFNSGEVNYRRRWVGPYSRFQGSWLVGVRHVDFSDRFEYQVRGLNNDAAASNGLRQFNSVYKVGNQMTGAQLGGDLWWNVYPGINLGMGLKGAVLGNTAKMNASIQSNSIGTYQASAKSADTSVMAEFDATLLYRFSYSWTFRTSYYLIGIEDVAFGANGLQNTSFTNLGAGNPAPTLGAFAADDSLTLQGFSFGLEYLW